MPQWNRVLSFATIEADFFARADSMVWCSLATVDGKGRPTSRVLHPMWELPPGSPAPTGWIATRPTSPKARDIAANPFVSVAYVQDIAHPLYVECAAAWADDDSARHHVWDVFQAAPAPLGYDPGPIFGPVDEPGFGVLRLGPWRIQLQDSDGTRRTWLR
jgi:general stress protein 26